MKKIVILTAIIVTMICCSTHRESNASLLFRKAVMNGYLGDRAPLADTLFHYSIPLMQEEGDQYVYVANPECSFCISKAINCINAWAETEIESPFIILSKTEYTELLEFFMKRDSKKQVLIFTSTSSDCLDDGLYVVRDKRVVSYSSWNVIMDD